MELWFKFEDIGLFDFILSTYLDKECGDCHRQGWFVSYYSENNEKLLRMTYTFGNDLYGGPEIVFEEKNTWRHLAFVWNPAKEDDGSGDPKNHTMYLDGVLRVAVDYLPSPYMPNTQGTPMIGFNWTRYDGSIAGDGKGANGYMKHMHVWNSVKSQADVRTIMENPDAITGEETDLVCGWRFTEIPDDDTDIKDLTGQFSARLVGDYRWVKK